MFASLKQKVVDFFRASSFRSSPKPKQEDPRRSVTRIAIVPPGDVGMYAKSHVGQAHPTCPALKCVRCDVVGCQGEQLKVAERYEEEEVT